MNADMFMFLFADMQVTFLQPAKTRKSHFLLLHREKMGSHILVETSRDPECPKVR